MSSQRPSSRDDFEIAIICALPLEYDAVSYLFDEFWDENGDTYGRAAGDLNSYTTGRMGNYNVVLALLPHMGKVNAAAAAASMRSSYENLRLALLVGVCGGLPYARGQEVLLGDVVISKTIAQFDFGRQYPDSFITKNTILDTPGRPNKDICNLTALFETDRGIDWLEERCAFFLKQLQAEVAGTKRRGKYNYPGPTEDKLFEATYRHKHQVSPYCICRDCLHDRDPVCDEALGAPCAQLGCDGTRLVGRKRLQPARQPDQTGSGFAPQLAAHLGAVASGDTVMKSAADRDRIAKQTGAIAFEMEGAGIWDEVPCIVIKGVCDYADSHKSKGWQNFAAATAASASKAILERYIRTDKTPKASVGGGLPLKGPPPSRPFSTVPFPPDPNFIERTEIISWLRDKTKLPSSRAALVGLGGVGKSQIAIHYAHEARQRSPSTWVFWVHASSGARFEETYRTIAERLNLPGWDDPTRNVLQLVYTWLTDEENGPWLMILDNVDTMDVFFPNPDTHASNKKPLASFIPKTGRGSVIITSRNADVAETLAGLENRYEIPSNMTKPQALQLLRSRLGDGCNDDERGMADLLGALGCLPLAITQAAAYIRRKRPRVSVSTYLDEFYASDTNRTGLLSREAADLRRDESASHSVVATWQMTFEQIQCERSTAVNLLSFMSFLNN